MFLQGQSNLFQSLFDNEKEMLLALVSKDEAFDLLGNKEKIKKLTYKEKIEFEQLQKDIDSLEIEEVGTLPGEIYCTKNNGTNPLRLKYSNDYGQSFTYRDIFLPGVAHYYGECDIHRGTEPGEIYLVVWPEYDSVILFHSFDYGQTLTLQSYMLITYDELFYTPGRTPGTFYYVRRQICGTPPRLNSCLFIYFSRDYGVTFTTNFYFLDSVFTGVPQKEILSQLKVFPNPATDLLNFKFDSKLPDCEYKIILYDLVGKPVAEAILPKGHMQVTMDTRNLATGIYCYSITNTSNAGFPNIGIWGTQPKLRGKIIINR